jgi:hypothetical protein
MVRQGRELEVAEALTERLHDDPDPSLQELLTIIDLSIFGSGGQQAAEAAESKAADAADAPPSVAETESHIMDPPTPPVVGGAAVSDCMAGESTAEARPHSPSVYSVETTFSPPRSPSVYSAETVFDPHWEVDTSMFPIDEDPSLPVAEVFLPVPQVNAGVEVPQGVAHASTSNIPRTFGRLGKNIHFSRCPIPLSMRFFFPPRF